MLLAPNPKGTKTKDKAGARDKVGTGQIECGVEVWGWVIWVA